MQHAPMANIYAEDTLPEGPLKNRVFDRMRRKGELHMQNVKNPEFDRILDTEFPDVRAWYDSLENKS